MHIFIRPFTIVAFTLLLGACVSIPGTNRKGLILISRDQEKSLGTDAYNDLLKKEKVSTNQKWNAVLQRVGARISKVTPVDDFDWKFTLIESKEMNAFCLPGGKVAFYTGIVPILGNEAAMAIVMGHEVAHAVARHGAQRMTEAMGLQFGMTLIDWAVFKDKTSPMRQVGMAALTGLAQYGAVLPHSRDNESEADNLGLHFAAAAGYDPAEAVVFWQRFSKATEAGGKPPEWMSTHPADATRIVELQRLQSEVQAIYQHSAKYGLGETL